MIGGSAGIGFETARVARAEGAKVIFTGWDPERLQRAATELGALSNVAFDATVPTALEQFFRDLPGTIDHVMVTAGGPYCGGSWIWILRRHAKKSACTSWCRSKSLGTLSAR